MDNKEIIQLYSNRFKFTVFYQEFFLLFSCNPTLSKNAHTKNECKRENILCDIGDIRVDLPISFGSINSKFKIIVIGLEPRDTHTKYNIEKVDRFVYGSPFGIEQWTSKNKYYKSFVQLINRNDAFIYFTDVVKEYKIKETKNASDKNARRSFFNEAEKPNNLEFLKAEINIIAPTHIIALGKQSYKFLKRHFGEIVIGVTHPNARQNKITKENAWDTVNRELQLIFSFNKLNL
jgi:uracil-DNA glycosylase